VCSFFVLSGSAAWGVRVPQLGGIFFVFCPCVLFVGGVMLFLLVMIGGFVLGRVVVLGSRVSRVLVHFGSPVGTVYGFGEFGEFGGGGEDV